MRKYKFRAWHSEQHRMYLPHEMGKDQLTLSVDGRGFINCHQNTALSIFVNAMIPELFTGLHDKNGKEIYDGDIVKDYDEGYLYIVIYNESDAQFQFHDFVNDDYYSNSDIADHEVIGNIHEILAYWRSNETRTK